MLVAILALLLAAPASLLVLRRTPRAAGIVLALATAASGGWVLSRWGFSRDAATVETLTWLEPLGVQLALRLDGLGATFVALVTGIGALVLVYASGYLDGKPYALRTHALLAAFTAAMLGLVIADDAVVLFMFWELTSITSYLLIGTSFGQEASRRAARQAMLVTGAGGVALLVGFVLLAQMAADSGAAPDAAWRLSTWLSLDMTGHVLYPAALALVLLGAFTKSAQFPFHFWLPAAMAAPTPVSALLHSATMVKAGVFLLARLHPALGGTPEWYVAVTSAGLVTMVYAAVMTLWQRDLKRILAWSTVAVLGTLVLQLGIGTARTVEATAVLLVAHALYKAALFMVAGNVDHATGTRDAALLSGLRRAMPFTALAGVLAALSKAGAPPLVGFLGKELLYTAKIDLESTGEWLLIAAVVANVGLVGAALLAGVRPFLGAAKDTPHPPHEAPWSMRLGPLVLGGGGLLIGLMPGWFSSTFGSAMATAIYGQPITMKLKLWHGVAPSALVVLGLSAATLLGGVVAFRLARRRLRSVEGPMVERDLLAGELFERGLKGLYAWAGRMTAALHNGSLRRYMLVMTAVTTALLVWVLARGGSDIQWGDAGVRPEISEWVAALLMVVGAVGVVSTGSRLTAVASLGVTGVGVALVFLFYSAPDLAVTQIMVETLTVILFVLVLYRMPAFVQLSSTATRWRDLLLAGLLGTAVALVLVAALAPAPEPLVSQWHAAHSVPEAHGRNIVNVILVDFRALDTLGETLVVAAAGLGVFALLRRRRPESPDEA